MRLKNIFISIFVSFGIGLVGIFFVYIGLVHGRSPVRSEKNTPVQTHNQFPNKKTLITGGIVGPVKVAHEKKVFAPILLYHHILDTTDGKNRVINDYAVSTAMFERQMTYLHENGYVTVRFDDLFRAMDQNSDYVLPEKSVIVSFDDGYDSQYTEAFPVLKKFGFTAMFFMQANAIDTSKLYMDSGQVRDLLKNGMDIGSHTMSHALLTDESMTPETFFYEINQSKITLEQKYGVEVRYFAYPYGKKDEHIERLVKEAGYSGARGIAHKKDHFFSDGYRIGAFVVIEDFDHFLRILKKP